MRRKNAVLLIILLIAGLASCRKNITHRVGRPLIGTMINLTIVAETHEKAALAAEAAFAEIERIEKLMSPRSEGGDVARINRDAGRFPVTVSEETFGLLEQSLRIWRETGGSFDITFASISHLWNFSREPFAPPPAARVRALLGLVDSGKIILDAGKKTVRFSRRGMKIGLGGIAKGYVIRRALEVMRSLGIEHAIVDAGGDLQVLGNKDGDDWLAGLVHPRTKELIIAIKMRDGDAVATSGDYERFAEHDGVRYHHIIDPATGFPANRLASVTVICSDPVEADAYATAIFVMGNERAIEFLMGRSGMGVILIDLEMRVWISRSMKERLVPLKAGIDVQWM